MCSVCGFDRLEFPAADYNICPSCGTEFGLDDVGIPIGQLRTNWISGGSVWWSQYEHQPADWNPILQLQNLTGTATISPQPTTVVSKSVDIDP